MVDAKVFPLDQSYAIAVADAEGVEPRRSAQARLGVVVAVIEKGLSLRAGVGDIGEIDMLGGIDFFRDLLHDGRSEEDVLGSNTSVLSHARGQDGRSPRPRWPDPAQQHNQSCGAVAQT